MDTPEYTVTLAQATRLAKQYPSIVWVIIPFDAQSVVDAGRKTLPPCTLPGTKIPWDAGCQAVSIYHVGGSQVWAFGTDENGMPHVADITYPVMYWVGTLDLCTEKGNG